MISKKLKVKDIMTKNIISVKNTDTITKAIETLVNNDIGSLLVYKNNEPVGIITERDIMGRVCVERLDCEKTKVEKVMSSPIITVDAEASIGEAAYIMVDKKIRRLIVMEKGKPVGIITQKDVMKATSETFKVLLKA